MCVYGFNDGGDGRSDSDGVLVTFGEGNTEKGSRTELRERERVCVRSFWVYRQ